MPTSRFAGVFRDLYGAAVTDAQMIESFVARGDETAFEGLVQRYGPMVLGVCRRVLRHAQDAEDAFQATFLVLVRKAGAVQRGEAVGNWLYGVAYRTAMQARARNARRRHKEGEARPMLPAEPPDEAAGRPEIQALLDRELSRLPEKYRAPLILCDLLGKTKRQAAQELCCPEGTVSSRLARGRLLLRKRLLRCGPGLASGAGVVVAPTLGEAVPMPLCKATVKAAALVAAGNAAAGALAPAVTELTEGVLKSMLLTKLKIVLGCVLVIAVAIVAGIMVQGSGAGEAGQNPGTTGKPPIAAGGTEKSPERERLRYDGKDFYTWRETLLSELKPSLRVEAIKALNEFGSRGYADETAAALIRVVLDYPFEPENSEDEDVIAAAHGGLLRIGPKWIDVFAKELESSSASHRRRVVQALGKMLFRYGYNGERVVSLKPDTAPLLPLLLRATKDADPAVRADALTRLIYTNSSVKAVTAAMSEALKDKDASVREAAAHALGNHWKETKEIVPPLVEVLKDSSAKVRLAAIFRLGTVGPRAKEALPALQKLQEDQGEPKELRDAAAKAIKLIRGEGAK
jgi:RNA polymerase sigma factor (sigma-70 family)